MKEKLVIVGAGMASGRMLEHLFEIDRNRFDVTLFGAEPRGNYNRILLSPVLAGEKSFDKIVTHDAAWYNAHLVNCRFGETITRIDRAAKIVHSAKGETRYDRLVVATGSAPLIIPVVGKELPGVIAFRDYNDVRAMAAAAGRKDAKAVVIGGGLLGLEAAAALRMRGMDVVVLHLMGHLMERQLDPAAGHLLEKEMESRGIKIHCKAQTNAILGDGRVEAVMLDDGTIYPADIVVMAVGIRPEVRIATDAGLHVERGIVVNDQMCSSDPNILAIGECCEHQNVCYGLVAPLYDMAKVAANTLTDTKAAFHPVETATQLKVTGVSLYSAGDFADASDREEIVLRDAGSGIYKRLVLKENRILGVVLYGETADGAWFFDMLRKGTDISEMRDALMFGPAYQHEGSPDPVATVATLPDYAQVCGCEGMGASAIFGARALTRPAA
jgi:nitrite reductase (NADH) large subunit